jgi:hypothetical protein
METCRISHREITKTIFFVDRINKIYLLCMEMQIVVNLWK